MYIFNCTFAQFMTFVCSDKSGRTALHSAAAQGSDSIVSLLLKWMSKLCVISALNQRDYKGWTPLLVAVCRGHTKVVSILLDAGADIFSKLSHTSPACRTTPTHVRSEYTETHNKHACA